MQPINRVAGQSTWEELVPTTDISHLLSEAERSHAAGDRQAFEELSREIDRRDTWEALYPVFYDQARDQLASGASRDDLQIEMEELAATGDALFAAIVREAYADALAGRSPQHGGGASS